MWSIRVYTRHYPPVDHLSSRCSWGDHVVQRRLDADRRSCSGLVLNLDRSGTELLRWAPTAGVSFLLSVESTQSQKENFVTVTKKIKPNCVLLVASTVQKKWIFGPSVLSAWTKTPKISFPFGFFAFFVKFWKWTNFTANHSFACVKCEKHAETQFELSLREWFEGQSADIEWSIFLIGGKNFSLRTGKNFLD